MINFMCLIVAAIVSDRMLSVLLTSQWSLTCPAAGRRLRGRAPLVNSLRAEVIRALCLKISAR